MTQRASAPAARLALLPAVSLSAGWAGPRAAHPDPRVLAKSTDADHRGRRHDAMEDIGPGLPEKPKARRARNTCSTTSSTSSLVAKQGRQARPGADFTRQLAYFHDKLAMEARMGHVAKGAATDEPRTRPMTRPPRRSRRRRKSRPPHPGADRGRGQGGAGAREGRRGFRQGGDRTVQGSGRRGRRPRLVHQGPHGAGIRRRRVQAAARPDLRSGEDPVRLAHHQGRGAADAHLPADRPAQGPGGALRRPEGAERPHRVACVAGQKSSAPTSPASWSRRAPTADATPASWGSAAAKPKTP